MKHKHVREAEYGAIKFLLDEGTSYADIERMVGRTYPTIKRIEESDTYADFRGELEVDETSLAEIVRNNLKQLIRQINEPEADIEATTARVYKDQENQAIRDQLKG